MAFSGPVRYAHSSFEDSTEAPANANQSVLLRSPWLISSTFVCTSALVDLQHTALRRQGKRGVVEGYAQMRREGQGGR